MPLVLRHIHGPGCGHVPIRKAATLTDIERLAAQYEPEITSALNVILASQAEAIDLDVLKRALETGDVGKVLEVIEQAMAAINTTPVVEALQNLVWASAAAEALAAPTLKAATFAFNRLNPRLIEFLSNYGFELIKHMNDSSKEAIRDKLIAGMTAGKGPIAQAVEIKEGLGLTPRQAKAVSNFRAQLEDFHLKRSAKGWKLGQGGTDKIHGLQVYRQGPNGEPLDGVTDRRLRDFRYDRQLIKAMETGKPLTKEQIDKMVAAYARKYRAYRAKTIARTESIRATAYGVQDAWRQAIESGKVSEELVYRRWIVADDERLCPVCKTIPQMNGDIAFGQPFATTDGPVMLPPVHPACRCAVFIGVKPRQTFKEG